MPFLPSNNRVAHAQNRLPPLLDVLDQLYCRGLALLHIVADIYIGLLLTVDYPLIVAARPELRDSRSFSIMIWAAFFGDVDSRSTCRAMARE